jgi:hypothetical protein
MIYYALIHLSGYNVYYNIHNHTSTGTSIYTNWYYTTHYNGILVLIRHITPGTSGSTRTPGGNF